MGYPDVTPWTLASAMSLVSTVRIGGDVLGHSRLHAPTGLPCSSLLGSYPTPSSFPGGRPAAHADPPFGRIS